MGKGSLVTSILLPMDMKYGQHKTRLFAYCLGLLTSVPVRLNKQAINNLRLICYTKRKARCHVYGLPADLDPAITAV